MLLLQLITFFATLLKCAVKVFSATLVKIVKQQDLVTVNCYTGYRILIMMFFAGALLHNHIFTQ